MLSAKRVVALAIVALAVAIGTMAMPARAQDVPQVISPLIVEQDPNGVNIATGRITMDIPTLSIPAAPRLTFDHVQNAAPYISGKLSQGAPDQQRVESHSAHLGAGGSESFNCVDYDCLSVTGTGSILKLSSVNRILTQSQSGTKYYYDQKHVLTTGTPGVSLFYASHVDYTDGEVISYTYDTAVLTGDPTRTFYRPNKVSSNVGYHIDLTYQGNDLNGDPLAWSSVAQATMVKDTAPTAALARLTYTWVGGNPGVLTITDIGSRVYNYTGTANALGVNLEGSAGSLQLPTEASAAKQVTPVAGKTIVGTVNNDGKQWSYSYTNPTLVAATGLYTYSAVAVTGPDSLATSFTLGQTGPAPSISNYIKSITDPLGRTTNFVIDGSYRVSDVTMPEGDKVHVDYDDKGNLYARTSIAKPGSGLANRVETLNFDDPLTCAGVKCWRPNWYKDAKGNQADYLYNGQGQLTERTEPADANGVRRKTIIDYDTGIRRKLVEHVCGLTTTCGTTQEIRTEYSYFGSTFLATSVRQVDQAGAITSETTMSYDDAGRLLVSDGPIAGTSDATYNRYDIYGRKIWEIGPAGDDGVRQAKITTYRDSDDKVMAFDSGYVSDPVNAAALTQTFSHVDTSYDGARNPIRQKVSTGGAIIQISDTSYDARNRPLCSAVRMNPAVFATVTTNACTAGTAGDQGPDRITKNIYDAAGELIQLRKGVLTQVEQAYATYSYTANGKQQYIIDANGNRAKMEYDGFDRPLKWIFPSTTKPAAYNPATQATALATAGSLNTADYEQYGYDANDNRTSLRKRDASTLTYTYDTLNRNTLKVVPERAGLAATNTRDVYTGYDLRNQPLYARFDSAAAASEGLTYTYDGLGRQLTAALKMDGVTRTLTYTYDLAGRRLTVKHPDNQTFTYAFDGAARVTSIKQATTTLSGFTYNSLGLPATMTTGVASSYNYDNLGRLTALAHDLGGTTSDVTYTLGYNAGSQMADRTLSNDGYGWTGSIDVARDYSVNGLNQYGAAGPASFSYDANGNLTSDGSSTYLYDIENRLVSASGGTAATLRYDPLGRLYETIGGGATTRLLYDGDELVGEYDGAGTMLRRYIHGAAVDDPVIWYEGSGIAGTALRRLRANWQGSIVAVTDNAGNLLNANSYDEWGIPAAGNLGRFQYTGQAWLPELGMYHYKARIYSPTLGRFLQTDPVGYDDQVNLYAYVANDPVNVVDPTGTEGACFYGPSQCGLRELTPEQQQDREDTVSTLTTVAITGASLLPAGRLLGWAGRALGIGRVAGVGSFQTAKGFINSRFALGEATKGRTTNFIGGGGRDGAERLFRTLTGQGDRAIDRGRTVVGGLRDGTKVNIRTQTLEGGVRRTTVETQRVQTGSRIPERLKVRFDEKIPD